MAVFFVAMALSACAHDGDMDLDEQDAAAQSAAAQEAMADVDAKMSTYMSDGNVEVYSLDSGISSAPFEPMVSAPALYGSADGGVASAHDPGVTVYPFENGDGMVETADGFALMSTTDIGGGGAMPASLSGNAPGTPAVLYFRHNSAALTADAHRLISDLSQAQRTQGGVLDVQAPASSQAAVSDPVQRRIVNLKVSMDRAYSVSRELIRDGVDPRSIRTTALGDAYPASSQGGMDADSASRRVEIRPDR